MKLALGTVQFGLDYGVSNQDGQVTPNAVKNILQQAEMLGIDTLDCAGAYGNSEKVLGSLGASERFNLISKVPALTAEQNSIYPFVEQTLTSLQCNSLHTLLFHQADNLINHPNKTQLFSEIMSLKKQLRVSNIGVSIYNPEQLKQIANTYIIDTVQVPINVFDQRFISADIIQFCKKKHIKLHARSLFLQGLLFIEKSQLQPYFTPYQDKLNAFSSMAKYLSCSKLTLALALLVQYLPNKLEDSVVDKLVVGVCNHQQLTEIVHAYQQAKDLMITKKELSLLADTRLSFINPSLWQL